jgi:hypothetical protein
MAKRTSSPVSWLGRLSDSTRGYLFGAILLAVVFPLIGWHESRAVSTTKALEQGAKLAVAASAEKLDDANNERLVCVTGDAKTDGELADPVFGVKLNAIKLQRTVEILQWVEHAHVENRPGGDKGTTRTVYSYSKQWSPQRIDSSRFAERGYDNASDKPWADWQGVASSVKVGVFPLTRTLVDQYAAFAPLEITEADHARLSPELREKLKRVDGGWTNSVDPAAPSVGDVRIRFVAARPGPVTVLARQAQGTFAPFYPDYPTPRPVEVLRGGRMEAAEILADYRPTGSSSGWIVRGVSFGLMWGGLALVGGIIARFTRAIPYIGQVAAVGERLFVAGMAVVCWLVTTGSYWFTQYPMFAILMYAGALLVLVVLFRRGKTIALKERKGSR